MYIVFIVLIFIAAILMVLAVLAQNPKGGMAANFGASNAVVGARQTADFLEKFTWALAVAIVVLSFAAAMTMPTAGIEQSNAALKNMATEQTDMAPELPMQAPAKQPEAKDSTAK